MESFDKSLYKVKRLFRDEGFENGFTVNPLEHAPALGTWTYPTAKAAPSWDICQWYSVHCLLGERENTGNDFELTDTHHSKRLVYNPEEKSLLMSLNAKQCYKGASKSDKIKYWPHLLIEQRNICDYKNMPEGEEKRFYSADADRIFAEFDIRLTAFEPTTNPEDLNACQFVAYVYLQRVGGNHIYFGFNPFDNRGPISFLWKKETGGSNWIYGLPNEVTYGNVENCFCPTPHNVKVSDEWKHIEVDLTPHIDFIMEAANRDLIFGVPVTKEEFYFSGTNVGFETHGNIDCTIEIKNYNLVSYIKK